MKREMAWSRLISSFLSLLGISFMHQDGPLPSFVVLAVIHGCRGVVE